LKRRVAADGAVRRSYGVSRDSVYNADMTCQGKVF
jgi:hypothetical protein